jgi:CheY-like chemotaxis protein/anti-sigma regulatory factor (Ser/Thr protein kinase)
MSHEIRSPLGSIMGFADLLKSPDLTREDVTQYISVIDRNSHHLLRIIDDILDLAKVEAGKMLIEHLEFSLRELLADFSLLMGFRARDKGIEFELRVPGLIPSSIVSDPTRLRQILTNVVGNAIKFTERGHVQLLVSFDIDYIQFIVSDTGPGISSEQLEKLFQPFQQADVSTTRRFGGTGLGLVLTRRLSEALGGTFKLLRSTIGQGSTFAATIRADVPKTARLIDSGKARGFLEQPKLESGSESKPLAGLKVLVVDDSPDNQILFQLILAKAGATIDIAVDGLDGVSLALTKLYDVVLMDVQMPRMDGYQATKELRSKGYTVPIVALTAHAMNEEKERAAQSGFTEFLSKPVQRDELLDLLKRFVN